MAINLRDLDMENIGSWPMVAKGVVCGIVFLLLIGLGYWFLIKDEIETLEKEENTELELKKTFEEKQQKAANLAEYEKQIATIQEYFGALLRQLPERTEVPGLVEDISQIGLENGLEFRSIKLQPEEPKEFYVELPIRISVVGNYHQMGEFVSSVAKLPRIVTFHDFTMNNVEKEKGDGTNLLLEMTAKTYRYTAKEAE